MAEYLDASNLIPTRPDHAILDSTKLKAYATCPRQFFWRYLLGWDRDHGTGPPAHNHLIFGEAWHAAMKTFLDQMPYSPEVILAAYASFMKVYRREIEEGWDDFYEPKTPAAALNALLDYSKTYQTDNFTVLYTEVVGSVPIGPDRSVHFRLDAVVETPQGIELLEHKTAGRLDTRWSRQWPLDIQVNLYLHAMHCLYGKGVDRAVVNGVGFAKSGPTFLRVPIRKTDVGMQAWLQTENNLMDRLEEDTDRLAYVTEGDTAMDAFHLNPTSCSNYYGCQYHDLCVSYANPLVLLSRTSGQPTAGFTESYWNPREREET